MKTKQTNTTQKSWAALGLARISIGLIFLWAYFDKLFGLGHETCRDPKTNAVVTMCSKAWAKGGSPTDGFLKFAAKGPLKGFYNGLAGNKLIAVWFMAGLLLIGVALVSGIATKLASMSGIVLLLIMWSAVLPPENNIILDDHIVYIFVLLAVYFGNAQQRFGLGAWWSKQPLVNKFPILG